MKRFILNAVSLWVLDFLFSGVLISDGGSLIVLTLILALCNGLIQPVLKFFSFPFTLMTLGLFGLVINGLVMMIAFSMVPGAAIDGLFTAIIASIVLSLVNGVLTDMFKE